MDSNDVEAEAATTTSSTTTTTEEPSTTPITAEGLDTVDTASTSDVTAENIESKENDDLATTKEAEKNVEEDPVKGDPEVAPIYVKRLVPVFANTFQNSLIPSVKKATLSILKKMIHSIPAQMMEEVVSGNVASQLVDVIAIALSVEVSVLTIK